MEPKIRTMTLDDLNEVHQIEKNNHFCPWSKGLFKDCIKVGYHCVVSEKRKKMCGFAIVQSTSCKSHLLNLCIDGKYQRKGYGSHLLSYVIDYSRAKSEELYLEVRASNSAAINLYEKHKFKHIKTIKNYYVDKKKSKEEAFVFSLEL